MVATLSRTAWYNMGIAKRACWVLVLFLDPLLETSFMEEVGASDHTSDRLPLFQVLQTNNAVVFLELTEPWVIDTLLSVDQISVYLLLFLFLFLFLAPALIIVLLSYVHVHDCGSFLLFVTMHLSCSVLELLSMIRDLVYLGLSRGSD